MTTVSPNPTHFELAWKSSEWGDEGPKLRNRTARNLRKKGYTVECESVSFADLARDSIAKLEAHKPGTPKSPFGAHMTVVHRDTVLAI